MTGRSSDKARVIDGLSYVSLGSYQGVCRMRCILVSTCAACGGLEPLVYEAFALSYWCMRPGVWRMRDSLVSTYAVCVSLGSRGRQPRMR